MVCLSPAMGLMAPRKMFPLVLRLMSPSACCISTIWGSALKGVEQINAGRFGKAEAGSDLGEFGFFEIAIVFDLLVELDRFRRGRPGGAVLFVFLGGGPIYQCIGQFFPIFAFGAVIADAIAFDLPFRDGLVGAVFQDEPAGQFLRGRARGEKESRSAMASDAEQECEVSPHGFIVRFRTIPGRGRSGDYLIPSGSVRCSILMPRMPPSEKMKRTLLLFSIPLLLCARRSLSPSRARRGDERACGRILGKASQSRIPRSRS